MFYLSKGEQAALVLLTAALLAGAGLLVYAKGRNAGEARDDQRLFVPAPAAPAEAYQAGAPAAGVLSPSPSPSRQGPSRSPATSPSPRLVPAPRAGLICINTATREELDRLPGIGPVYAGRIVAYREQRRREGGRGFESKDELLNVPGIGPKRYSAIKDLVTL
ncbi:MAG: ComEA family DNA-binding protein [Armatimonadota bacterium]